MKEQLFRVSAKHKETSQAVTLHVWAASADAATDKLTDALFGINGAYRWTGTAPEYKDNETVKREI